MTEVAQEIRIETIADVEGIDVTTDNRLAVRSLRHGARAALKQAAREVTQAGYDMRAAAYRMTSLGCDGTESRDRWLTLLQGSSEQIDAQVESTKVALKAALEQLDGRAELAKASLVKAVAVLEAHPDGLPAYEGPDTSEYPESYDDDTDGEGEDLPF